MTAASMRTQGVPLQDPDLPALIRGLPDFGLLIGAAMERTFDPSRGERNCCGHVVDKSSVHTCVLHETGHLICNACMADHIGGHDAASDGTCANCGATDCALSEIIVHFSPQNFWLLAGRDEMTSLSVVAWGGLLCDHCKIWLPLACPVERPSGDEVSRGAT